MRGTTPSAETISQTWAKALAKYRSAWGLWDQLPENFTNEQSDEVAAIAFPAWDRLLATPAPDLGAVLFKIEEAILDDHTADEVVLRAIMEDVRRLQARTDPVR